MLTIDMRLQHFSKVFQFIGLNTDASNSPQDGHHKCVQIDHRIIKIFCVQDCGKAVNNDKSSM